MCVCGGGGVRTQLAGLACWCCCVKHRNTATCRWVLVWREGGGVSDPLPLTGGGMDQVREGFVRRWFGRAKGHGGGGRGKGGRGQARGRGVEGR